ncbi:MAG TPA: PIG-L deacetylase family protein [Micromonosporaceae bacterium]|nr:PIG-L deacetylase family protein [Micromonosporaceae bacterium]
MSFPPSPPPLPGVRRVLAVFAHPDDVDFGSAGTVATWVDAGIEVTYLMVTKGEAGSAGGLSQELLADTRETEQRTAAGVVGVHNVEFLDGYPDGAVYFGHRLRRDITRAIRRWRPDRVLTNSPLRRWDSMGGPNHPDHLAVGEATVAAVYPDARNRYAHCELLTEEGLEPWTVREVWFSGGPSPDHFVDITETAERKFTALRSHASQLPDPDSTEQMLRKWLGQTALTAGFGEDRLAEAFSIVRNS